MALTIASLPNKKFKAIVKSDGRIIKTKTFSKKSLAKAWGRSLEVDQERISAYGLSGSKITLKEFHKEYVDYLYKDSGLKDIQGKLIKSKLWVNKLGDYSLLDISSELIEGVLAAYQSGRSPASRNRHKAEISAILKYAVKKKYIKENPCKDIPNLREPKGIVRFLSTEERGRLLNACLNSNWERLHLIVNLALTTGARRSELTGLKWADIDMVGRTAMLTDTKNGESRVLPLVQSVISELKSIRLEKIESGLLFPSIKNPNKPKEFKSVWYKALDEANIENLRFHDLRHDCASTLAMNGATLLQIGEVLGHKSTQTTKRYSHLSTSHKAELINSIFE